ncbi:hypothetical protein BV22DRAFT_395408 [Leucogyrophana mollusca]|uniref:Uncharacterized protein n=1 Tax=Leucogyrophana mollusca TaxID=85980 RepID=A0ACB8BKM1_9AGAM|nr:hypothetical protein BV22DRAFT_395408 [Leucogyrophana mollusca]
MKPLANEAHRHPRNSTQSWRPLLLCALAYGQIPPCYSKPAWSLTLPDPTCHPSRHESTTALALSGWTSLVTAHGPRQAHGIVVWITRIHDIKPWFVAAQLSGLLYIHQCDVLQLQIYLCPSRRGRRHRRQRSVHPKNTVQTQGRYVGNAGLDQPDVQRQLPRLLLSHPRRQTEPLVGVLPAARDVQTPPFVHPSGQAAQAPRYRPDILL